MGQQNHPGAGLPCAAHAEVKKKDSITPSGKLGPRNWDCYPRSAPQLLVVVVQTEHFCGDSSGLKSECPS